jgi:hypothetical protein
MEPEGSLRVHKKPTLNPSLSQINPVHNLSPYFWNVLLNIDLPIYTLVSKVARNASNIYLNHTTKIGSEKTHKLCVFHC